MVITHHAHERVRDIDREPSFLVPFAFRVRQDAQRADGRSELLLGRLLVRDSTDYDMLFTSFELLCLLNTLRKPKKFLFSSVIVSLAQNR